MPAGSPYLDSAADLPAGQSHTYNVEFVDRGGLNINYSPRVLAGPGSR